MKHFLFFSSAVVLILSLTLFSCRKESPKEHPSSYVKFTSDCTNGLQDGDESGVDCGGSCVPCSTVDLSCNLDNDEFVYMSNSYTALQGSMMNGESLLTLLGGGVFKIDFGQDPTTSGVYTATEMFAGGGDFTCYYIPSGSSSIYYSDETSGNVMVTVSAFNINVEFCDLKITANGGSTYRNISGNLNFY